jgi:hypothetical protein
VVNIYFDLTEELNAEGVIVALSSGQATVYYRIAIMSKDGDWVLREDEAACARVLSVLDRHGARYRPGAPLDVRWLAKGWSSHFEFQDAAGRRIRCDFVTRPPRVSAAEVAELFAPQAQERLRVVPREPLIKLKQTQRAKDYLVISELARALPPADELRWTTDVDRLIELARDRALPSDRAPVQLARGGAERSAVVASLAQEVDALQQADRRRMQAYVRASEPYMRALRAHDLGAPLAAAHREVIALAERHLPPQPEGWPWSS